MNRYRPHIYVIPEDDADRQLADGFVLHHQVIESRIQIMPPAGGWSEVLKTFRDEYIPKLHQHHFAHVVMLIDFDNQVVKRTAEFIQEIPPEFKNRVFVLGLKDEPETLKKELKLSFEKIGMDLAEDCNTEKMLFWNHEQLQHNDAERQRLIHVVKPFLF